ncbi:tetratricopeptide repeat protein [Aquimarina sp. 2201CG14-23]|uniref:tetratricopeptide repeat protein n=1 Tax=Aquimarina mycalae TaxID=3040073 RepID=UPI002477DF44|nr:tetratricopeptide repeat protein [Aquimarina sp. 2201CG14-23]MDH7447192.1 tetratricopeptide repeat protein [Aquimarina sp. 2201CG14-23]
MIALSEEYNKDIELHNHYNAKGNIYLEMRQYKKALDYYQKVYTFCKKQDQEKFIPMIRTSMLNIAKVYSNLGDYELAHQYYMEIIEEINLNPSTEGFANIHRSVALNYERQEKISEAIQWIRKSLHLADMYNHKRLGNVMLVDLCDFLIQNKEYQEAKKIYDKVDENFKQWNKNFYLGKIYAGLNTMDKAEIEFVKSIANSNDIKITKEAIWELSEIYLTKDMFKKAIDYKDRYYKITDSLTIQSNKVIISNNEAAYKLVEEELTSSKLKTENELLQATNRQQKYVVIGAIVLSLIGICCMFLLFKNIKTNREVKILKEKEKKLLEDKVRLRENELNTLAMTITDRQKMLTDINRDIKNVNGSLETLGILRHKLRKLESSGDHISMITERIESQYPNAVFNLKERHDWLSDTEIKYCLLTKLNLSLKETANILGVTANTVKTSRSRIKKKMEIPNGISFKGYLEEILV